MVTSTAPAASGGSGKLVGSALLAILAAALIWVPFSDLAVSGPFAWHLRQAQTWQGGLEAVALYAVVAAALLLARSRTLALGLSAAAIALYLRRHHVDLPAVAAWAFVEILIALGAAVSRLAGRPARNDARDPLRFFLGGVVIWTLLSVAASAAGRGTPHDLRLLTLGAGLIAVAISGREPWAVTLARRLGDFRRDQKAVGAYFIVTLAVQMARTNVTYYYDSLWYGLRGEYVLAAERSFFDQLGLVGQVHYYPKLYELLLLPLAGLGDHSFVLAMGVGCLALLQVTVVLLLRRLDLSLTQALLGAAVLCSLPAVENMALTSKPDLFATLLLLIATLSLWDHLRGGESALLGFSALLLALAVKITSVPYGVVLVSGFLLGAMLRSRRGPALARLTSRRQRLAGWILCGGAAAVLIAITLRTYLLTGVPTVVPTGLVRLWERLGFELHGPAGFFERNRFKDVADVPALAFDFLFRPTRLPLAQITWTGNVWLFLLLAALLWGRRTLASATRERSVLLVAAAPVVAAGLGFALLYNNYSRGGDGNYYMFPLVVFGAVAFALAASTAARYRAALVGCLVVFIAVQSLIGFLTAAWSPGTSRLDLRFDRSVIDTPKVRDGVLAEWGLDRIARFLEAQPGVARVVGGGPEGILNWLPARYESLGVLAQAKNSVLERPETFLRYLETYRIDYLLVSRVETGGTAGAVIAALERRAAPIIETRLHRLFDLHGVDLGQLAVEAPAVETRVFDFVEQFGAATKTGLRPKATTFSTSSIEIATPPVVDYVSGPALLMAEGTSLEYSLEVPLRETRWRARVGLAPLVELWGSTEAALELEVCSERCSTRSSKLRPGSGYADFDLPLVEHAGRRARFRITAGEASGDGDGWILLAEPRLVMAR
jgi:hypothetical protein